jgi:hypothetical protein
MTTKTIKLQAPVEWFGEVISEVELREPTGGEFLVHGDPRTWARTAEGAIFYVDRDETITSYLDKCLKVEHGSQFLARITLIDAKLIKDSLIDFFSVADTVIAARKDPALMTEVLKKFGSKVPSETISEPDVIS